jgi:hypothetical protein
LKCVSNEQSSLNILLINHPRKTILIIFYNSKADSLPHLLSAVEHPAAHRATCGHTAVTMTADETMLKQNRARILPAFSA